MSQQTQKPQPVQVDPLKALFDKTLSALILLLASPLLIAVALAIVIDGLIWSQDRGPIFHRETRVSAGRRFTLLKFRTMQVGAIQQAQDQGLTVKCAEKCGSRCTL